MKRITVLIITLIVIIIGFIIYYNTPKNYNIFYKVNDISINEFYNKKTNYLSFIINYNKVNYPLVIENKNFKDRKIISNINQIEKDNITCLNVKIYDNTYPLCSKNNEVTDYRLLPRDFLSDNNYEVPKDSSLISDNKNIKLYNDKSQIIIWNYNGFYDINNNKQIEIFNNEKYTNRQTFQADSKLIIPDYDSKYYFTKIYIYDIENEKLELISFDDEISFDLYYLGTVNNNSYFIDKKNKIEYKIDLNKNIVEKLKSDPDKAIYYDGNNFIELSFNKLIKTKVSFINYSNFDYKIIDNKLFLSILGINMQCSNKTITDIIKISNESVYYLVKDNLYKYSIKEGEILLAKYSEWNFNYLNQIFILN